MISRKGEINLPLSSLSYLSMFSSKKKYKGMADVDSYGNADSTQDEDSALNNAAIS